jgi:hypothetical protein
MGDRTLTTFWIAFPKDPGFPLGMGVTAWSRADAFRLLEDKGYDFHLRASEVSIREGVTLEDIQSSCRPIAGPLAVRGVWYPCWNVGFGAPGAN